MIGDWTATGEHLAQQFRCPRCCSDRFTESDNQGACPVSRLIMLAQAQGVLARSEREQIPRPLPRALAGARMSLFRPDQDHNLQNFGRMSISVLLLSLIRNCAGKSLARFRSS
jgi:hypothetical protein